MLVSLEFSACFFPSNARLVRLSPFTLTTQDLRNYSAMPLDLNPKRRIFTLCILEYRSHLARQRNKVKILITDDELDSTLGELLFVNIRSDRQLAFLRHFHTASFRATKSHHHCLFHLLTLLAVAIKLPEQQKISSSTALSTVSCPGPWAGHGHQPSPRRSCSHA
jgi:hypothetical protein